MRVLLGVFCICAALIGWVGCDGPGDEYDDEDETVVEDYDEGQDFDAEPRE